MGQMLSSTSITNIRVVPGYKYWIEGGCMKDGA